MKSLELTSYLLLTLFTIGDLLAQDDTIHTIDQITLGNLLAQDNTIDQNNRAALPGTIVLGDFDNDGKKDDIAAFYDYGIVNGKREAGIHVWKGGGKALDYRNAEVWIMLSDYDARKIAERIVVGDFDHDGYEDDIAAFYDYSFGEARIHVFKGDTGSFYNYGEMGWWNIDGYDVNMISGRVVCGNFDPDGYKDDIAVFYDYRTGGTHIHMFRGMEGSFRFVSSDGWWKNTNYKANSITNRVVVGDFDKDNKEDDIAVFYDYGEDTRVQMFFGKDSYFYYPSVYGWKNLSSYKAKKVTGKVVCGDFNNDGFNNDIAMYYDYGNEKTRMQVLIGKGAGFFAGFNFPSRIGMWSALSGYDAKKIAGRVVAGDFFNDGTNNSNASIAAFYTDGNDDTRLHSWKLISPLVMEHYNGEEESTK